MKLLSTRAVALATLVCGFCTDVSLAMDYRNIRSRPVIPEDFSATDSTIYNATFEQLIDHENPSLGTFSQFYYYSIEYWKGPGSPVVSSTMDSCKYFFRHSIMLIVLRVGLFHSGRNSSCRLSTVSSSSRIREHNSY